MFFIITKTQWLPRLVFAVCIVYNGKNGRGMIVASIISQFTAQVPEGMERMPLKLKTRV